MKKYIIEVNDNGNAIDKDGTDTCIHLGGCPFIKYEEQNKPKEQTNDIAKLITLGVTPDDLLKLRASGII